MPLYTSHFSVHIPFLCPQGHWITHNSALCINVIKYCLLGSCKRYVEYIHGCTHAFVTCTHFMENKSLVDNVITSLEPFIVQTSLKLYINPVLTNSTPCHVVLILILHSEHYFVGFYVQSWSILYGEIPTVYLI